MTADTEKPLGGRSRRKPKESTDDIDRRVASLLADTLPVENSGWILKLRPSQALICCIGSGPWKLPRRERVQKEALHILGTNDLIEKRNELASFFPLDWQKSLVTDIGRYFHLVARSTFDQTSTKPTSDVLSVLSNAIGKDLYDFPKVMCMYVRDYLEIPICPRDRHVNDKLKAFGVPLSTQLVTESMIRVVGPGAVNEYARGIFEGKSTNPKH